MLALSKKNQHIDFIESNKTDVVACLCTIIIKINQRPLVRIRFVKEKKLLKLKKRLNRRPNKPKTRIKISRARNVFCARLTQIRSLAKEI